MTEEVLLTVKGSQLDLGEDASTEVMAAARYYLRNNKHYLVYDEPVPEEAGQINNTVKVTDKRVDVIRRGSGVHVHMVFEEGKPSASLYTTGVGDLAMDIFTESVKTTIDEDKIEAIVHYSFSMNGEFISKCIVEIRALAKKPGLFE